MKCPHIHKREWHNKLPYIFPQNLKIFKILPYLFLYLPLFFAKVILSIIYDFKLQYDSPLKMRFFHKHNIIIRVNIMINNSLLLSNAQSTIRFLW